MSPTADALAPWQQALAMLVWYAFLTCFLVGAIMLSYAGAVDLSISGSSTGFGAHVLSFSGAVNASLIQGLNNSSWQILATGAV